MERCHHAAAPAARRWVKGPASRWRAAAPAARRWVANGGNYGIMIWDVIVLSGCSDYDTKTDDNYRIMMFCICFEKEVKL